MLVSITWSEYGVIILAALVVYYTVLVIVYFKNKVLSLRFEKEQYKDNLSSEGNKLYQADKGLNSFFQNKIDDNNIEESRLIDEDLVAIPELQISQPELFTSHQKYIPSVQETDDTFQEVQELTARLKEVIAQAVEKNYIKAELILSLQLLLKKYQFLKGSSFLVAINNLIVSECEKYGYIHLSAEERVMLWNE